MIEDYLNDIAAGQYSWHWLGMNTSVLMPVLAFGKKHCPPDDYIFQGRYSGTPLSQRMLELIVRRARNAAGIIKPVTPMTLRHSYAVHCLEAGASVRSVQASLGHQDIRSSWRYVRCTLPDNLESPLDTLKRKTGRNRLEENCFEPPTIAPTQKLFAEPPSVEPMDLPFREPEDRWGSRIYRLLKTHFSNRFLCSRRQSPRSG